MTEFFSGPILNREHILACELAAVDHDASRLYELQHVAAQAIADWVALTFNPAYRVLAVTGSGNNGGDGRLAASFLEDKGFLVEVFSHDQPTPELAGGFTVILDALLGTGLTGPLRPDATRWIEWINLCRGNGAYVVSIDVPSGIDGDTGIVSGMCVHAQTTLVLGALKPFLFQNDGLDASGQWIGVSLRLPLESLGTDLPYLVDPSALQWGCPRRSLHAHKGSSGHVLILAGSPDMPGAAHLCVRGALASGAGLVTLASHPDVLAGLASNLPEAKHMPLASDSDWQALGHFEADSAVIGPGLGRGERSQSRMQQFVREWKNFLVIDADALPELASRPANLLSKTIATPHPGEMGRLLNKETNKINRDRFAAARQASQQFGACFVLKGPYSVIADASRLSLNPSGNSGMATGGMGDVLAGVLAAIAVQSKDLSPRSVAELGTFIHGAAADLCAQELGPIGYRASQVADAIPRVMSRYLA